MLCLMKPLFAFPWKNSLQNFFFSVPGAAPCVIRNPNYMEIRAKLCSHWSAHLKTSFSYISVFAAAE